jgi:signal transduction histidine kinase
MIAPVSAEFLAICQSQLQGLVQGLGASWTILYIPEEWLDASLSNLIPIAMYPEAAPGLVGLLPRLIPGPESGGDRSRDDGVANAVTGPMVIPQRLSLASAGGWVLGAQPIEAASASAQPARSAQQATQSVQPAPFAQPAQSTQPAQATQPAQPLRSTKSARKKKQLPSGLPEVGDAGSSVRQLLQPLHYNQRLMGVLMVARREGEDWSEQDYAQMEQVAATLAAACGLEQRSQWWQGQLEQHELAQERQQDVLDNLIHQLRNPLTALRTFGKLLLRRLQADDPNRSAAEAIVRESDRLQGLLQQLQATVEDLTLLAPVEGSGWSAPAAAGAPVTPLLLSAASPSATPSPTAMSGLDSGVGMALPAPISPAVSLDLVGKAGPVANAGPVQNPLGREPLSLSACEMVAIVALLLPSFEAIAQDQGQVLLAELITPLSALQGNSTALQEVLSNLLENALKYSSQGGTIALRVSQPLTAPGWQYVDVCDDGPGIPSGDLPHVFERHYRGVQSQGAKGGTGLGLAIVAALVQQMGGTIEVLSPAPWRPIGSATDGPGTLFRVKLRLADWPL